MKKLNSIFLLLALLISTAAFSQDATNAATEETAPTFTLSGSIDTYAHTSLGVTNGAFGEYAPTTSFGNLRGFSLGMANIIASYAGEKAGFTADLVFGPRGRAAVFYGSPELGSVTDQRIINQMFAYYKLSDAVTLNLGQFNTFVGYEVISPAINANYSTSYLFSNGPFNHTGLRADFSFGDGMVAKLAIMNPTDMLEWNPVNTFTFGAQIGKTSDAGGVWLNVLYGDQDGNPDKDDPYETPDGDPVFSFAPYFQVDVTGGYTLSDAVYLGFNVSYQSIKLKEYFQGPGDLVEPEDAGASNFMGIAVYPKFTLSESFALALRAEYFATAGGTATPNGGTDADEVVLAHPLASPIATDADGDGNVIAITASGNWKVGPLTIIPEIRFDKTSEDSFFDDDGEATDSMISATLAAVYKF
jgi:hypothetical protein